MSAAVDRDRQAVYDAEDVAFGGTAFDEAMPFADAADLLRAFCSEGWWEGSGLPVPVAAATRVDSTTSYARIGGEPSIHLSPDGCTVATVSHELAHLLAHVTGPHGEPHHGPAFRRADIALAGALMGAAAAERLAASFAAAGLALGPEPTVAGAAPAPAVGFWTTWRAARALADAGPASGAPIAL